MVTNSSDNNSHIDLNSQFNKRAIYKVYWFFKANLFGSLLKNKKEIYKQYKLLNKLNEK